MAMTINTNVASINAQRNLGLSGSSLSTSMQRLSSGLRVNSAKDDAAGLAISERMGAQTKGLTVAARNANDGISLAQTAEGALGKVGDMLQRVRELAVQSSNATNSTSDREAMQSEVDQMVAEIDRVAKTTEFNGKKLLDGSFSGAMFQVGANAGDNITVGSLTKATAGGLGAAKYAAASGGIAAATVLTAATNVVTVTGKTGAVNISVGAADTADERLGQTVAAINAKTADTGVTAFLEKDAAGTQTLKFKSEGDFTVAVNTAAAAGITGAAATTATVQTGGISALSVATQSGAWEALQKVDDAIDQVNSARGDLGALQTRFEKTVENIDIQNENISAAKGRITDADFAVETANLSKAQILQQAGTAMVAQANQLPQSVLSLLR